MQSQSLMQKLQDLVDKLFAVPCTFNNIRPVNTSAQNKYEMAKTVPEKTIPFYCKANIPLISERKACQKIIKAVDENAKLRRIPKQRREKPSCLEERKDTTEKIHISLLAGECWITTKNSEDVNFSNPWKPIVLQPLVPKMQCWWRKIQR